MLPAALPCCHSRSLLRTQGIKFLTNIFKFRGFIDPSDQNELYHTSLLSKIRGLSVRKKLWHHPFKWCLPVIGVTTTDLFCSLMPLSLWIFSAMGLSLMDINARISILIATSGSKPNMLKLYQSKAGGFHDCNFLLS